jgi:nitroreductase
VAPVDAPAKPDSALHLVLVEDQARFQYAQAAPESKISFAGFAAGAISQNVYLFCASEGLATVVRASIGKPELTRLLRLRPDQRVLYVQAVGYPAR